MGGRKLILKGYILITFMNTFISCLEITKLWKWRTDQFLPGVGEVGSGCGNKKAIRRILVVTELQNPDCGGDA